MMVPLSLSPFSFLRLWIGLKRLEKPRAEPHQALSSPFKPFQALSSPFKPFQALSSPFKPFQAFSSLFKPDEKLSIEKLTKTPRRNHQALSSPTQNISIEKLTKTTRRNHQALSSLLFSSDHRSFISSLKNSRNTFAGPKTGFSFRQASTVDVVSAGASGRNVYRVGLKLAITASIDKMR